MHIGPVTPKRKYTEIAVLGRLWALPWTRLPLHPPMLVVFPRVPTHLAISLDGGPLQIAEVEVL